MNFFYPTWYQLLDINQTIEKVMPQHLYKKEFIQTDAFEHQRLFGEIVIAVQNNGKGLGDIIFYDVNNNPLGKLLTENEIIHLQDVSNLVSSMNWISLALLATCFFILALIIFYKLSMPPVNKIIIATMAIIVFLSLVIILFGAKKFFYWLHTVVFPENHQWFFYYEESLMTTLMKAPVLFAPISVQLIFLGLVIWILQLWLLNRFYDN